MLTKATSGPKIVAVAITLISILLYLPVNRLVSGGYNLELPIDNMIPLIPIFVVPYLFGIIFWISTIVFVNLKQDKKTSAVFNLRIILASIISVFIYIIIPTFVTRPLITGIDVFSNLLSFVYSNDRTYNAAPSGHTFYTVICFLTLSKLLPKRKVVWTILSILIILSTLFTGQHNVLDVLLGILFAIIIYLVSPAIINLYNKP